MRSKAKMKLSLLASMGVSLLAVASASISTFAWFQAQADVEITTSGASTTITVSGPDDATLSGSLYYYSANGNYGYLPAANNATENAFSFADFSNTDLASHLSLTNLHPGYRMSFCVKVTNDKAISTGSIVLTITNFTAASHAGISSYRNDVTNSGYITLAKAIRIYTGYATSSSGHPTLSSNKFSYTSPSTNKYEIFKQTSGIGSETYLYYTVEFSNDSSTLYNEFSNSAAASITNYVRQSTISASDTTTRYFRTASSTSSFGAGDSNCYMGLRFYIPQLTISVSSL